MPGPVGYDRTRFGLIPDQYERYAMHSSLNHRLYRQVVHILSPIQGKCVLDYGCGTGLFAEYLTRLGAHVYATDCSPAMLNFASSVHRGNVNYVTLESGHVSLDAETVDAAVCILVFVSQPTRDSLSTILVELFRVIKPGGTLIIADIQPESLNNLAPFLLGPYRVYPKLTDGVVKAGRSLSFCFETSKPGMCFELIDYYWPLHLQIAMLTNSGFRIDRLDEQELSFVMTARKSHSKLSAVLKEEGQRGLVG